MANLWITGDSWGVLDPKEPKSHWVNFCAQHYNLKNIYCLARSGISQDMINYITECVIKNVNWKDRDVKFSNMDDHLIIFPTTPTRITFNKVWDRETFDYNQGPHNLNWKALSKNKFKKEKEMFELRVKHQKFVQEHLFEEFVKVYMHPTRIQKLLDMGYTIDELDDVL